MHFIENGPFSSNAPTQDNSYQNLSKEETDILLSTYGDEISYQYALSLMDFAKSNSHTFKKYVNLVLNTLTTNEHEKYLNYLKEREKQKEESVKENIVENESEAKKIKIESTEIPYSNAASNQLNTQSQLNNENQTSNVIKQENHPNDTLNDNNNFVNAIEPTTSTNLTINADSN